MSKSFARRHYRLRALAGAATAGVLASTLISGTAHAITNSPAVAPAKQLTQETLSTGSTAITTSTGTKLKVSLFASARSDLIQPELEVNTHTAGYAEEHDWTFPMPDGVLPLDGAPSGSFAMPSAAVAPYGIVKVKYAKSGKATKTTCDAADYDLNVPVTVKGRFFFDTTATGKHAWGTIGHKAKSKKFSFKAGTLDVQYGTGGVTCRPLPALYCGNGVQWSLYPNADDLTLNGGTFETEKPKVFGSRSVTLDSPVGASRYDAASSTTPAPMIKPTAGGGATMKIRGGGSVTGSAKLVSTEPPQVQTDKCAHHKKMTSTFWGTSTFVQGSTPLVVHMKVFGSIKLEAPTNGTFGTAKVGPRK